MADTVQQASTAPTNKTNGALVGTFVWAACHALVDQFVPGFGGDYFWVSAAPIFVLVGGYVIKDAPNVSTQIVVHPEPEPAMKAKAP